MQPARARRQAAQSLIEFGLIIALVAFICVASLLVFGGTVSSMMSSLSRTVASNLH